MCILTGGHGQGDGHRTYLSSKAADEGEARCDESIRRSRQVLHTVHSRYRQTLTLQQ